MVPVSLEVFWEALPGGWCMEAWLRMEWGRNFWVLCREAGLLSAPLPLPLLS